MSMTTTTTVGGVA